MKLNICILIIVLAIISALPGQCQPHLYDGLSDAQRLGDEANRRAAQAKAEQERLNAQQTAELAELQKIYAKDPWRRIEGNTNAARGTGWYEFQGEVGEILHEGVVFKGKWGPVLTVTPGFGKMHLVRRDSAYQEMDNSGTTGVQDTSVNRDVLYGDDLFFVDGFPYPSRIGQAFQEMMGKEGDYFTYTNRNNQVVTIRRLIYGTPCAKIFSPEELAAPQKQADAKKQELADKLLKRDQKLADNGDAFGYLQMGERCRDGNGVPKDLIKARDYLNKAAAAGSPTAEDDLKHLPKDSDL